MMAKTTTMTSFDDAYMLQVVLKRTSTEQSILPELS